MRPLFIAILSVALLSTGCMDTDSEYTSPDEEVQGAANIDLETIEGTDFYRDSFNGSGGYMKSSDGGNTFLDDDIAAKESVRTFMINYRDEENAGKFTEGPPNVIISGYISVSEPVNLDNQVEKRVEELRNDSLREIDSVNEKDGKFIIRSREVAGNRTARYSFKTVGKVKNSVYSITLVDFEGYKEEAGLELAEILEKRLEK